MVMVIAEAFVVFLPSCMRELCCLSLPKQEESE